MTSAHDDDKGVWQTYNHLVGPRAILQPLASSGAFLTFLNSGLMGAFAALVALAFNAPGPLVGIVAAACGLCFFGVSIALGRRQYQRIRRSVLFPAPDADSQG